MIEHFEHGSGVVTVIKYLCALTKEPKIQNKCKYYIERYLPNGKPCCFHLGNWDAGLQMCNCKQAQLGYLNAIQELNNAKSSATK